MHSSTQLKPATVRQGQGLVDKRDASLQLREQELSGVEIHHLGSTQQAMPELAIYMPVIVYASACGKPCLERTLAVPESLALRQKLL